jgi:hypothetical protein
VVCDIYILCCLHGKAKKRIFRGGFPSAWVAALGEEVFFKKRQISSPSVWAAALGEEVFF